MTIPNNWELIDPSTVLPAGIQGIGRPVKIRAITSLPKGKEGKTFFFSGKSSLVEYHNWLVVSNIFSPLLGEMIQFDEHIFQMGWNDQPV